MEVGVLEGLGFVDTESYGHVEARVVSTLGVERCDGHHRLEEVEKTDAALKERSRHDPTTHNLAICLDKAVEPDLVGNKSNIELLGERDEDIVQRSWAGVFEVKEGLIRVEHVDEGGVGGIDVEPWAWLKNQNQQELLESFRLSAYVVTFRQASQSDGGTDERWEPFSSLPGAIAATSQAE